MIPDPPHKKGFYTDIPKNKTFVKWNDMSNYQTKIDKLNIYLEKQQNKRQKEMYRNVLDDIVRQKQQQKNQENNIDKLNKDQEQIKKIYDLQQQQENKFKQNVLKINKKILENQRSNQKKYKKLQIETAQQEFKESKLLEEVNKRAQTERVKRNFLEFNQLIKQNQQVKEQQKYEQLQKEKQFDKAEKQNLHKIMQNNQRFIDNVKKYQRNNDKVYNYYKKIYDKKEEEEKLFEQKFVDRFHTKKIQDEIQREDFERNKRKLMQNENRNFLLNQIENNMIKNKYENFNNNKEDFLNMQESIQKQEQQLQQQEKERKQKYQKNLKDLIGQMNEKKKSKSLNHMSKTEARINNHSVVRVDFEKPTTDLIGGIPGFSKPFERTHQLDIINNNFKNSQQRIDQLINHQQRFNKSNNKLKFAEFKKQYKQKYSMQIQDVQKQNFENEYEFIRHKNTTKPFNIISNELKGYETFRQLIQLFYNEHG